MDLMSPEHILNIDPSEMEQFNENIDDMVRQGFRDREVDPRHFEEWRDYDEDVGSEIEGTPIPGGYGRHEYTEEGQSARDALSDILRDLENQYRDIGPEGDWKKVLPSIVGQDPFRMTQSEMDTELEDMATEMGRREGRKEEKQEDKMNEEDWGLHGIDEHLRQNYFKNFYDSENPQNERLINVKKPQMDERTAKLIDEMERRSD